MKTILSAFLLSAAILLPAGCEKATPPDRAGRLLIMAGEEAASIPNTLERFTRQLNIAHTQVQTNRKADADKILLLARDTLTGAKKEDFDDFHRIAGWTAISQLSRAADDRDLALKSSDLALAALNDVQPAAERPQYVLSLAGELADLRGKEAAIELLGSGSAWAADIREPGTRRMALVAFADQLISLDAYENARTTLRRDPDPAWRTDTFLALANGNYATYDVASATVAFPTAGRGGGGGGGGRGGAAGAMQPQAARQAGSSNSFGKDVRFENVYQQSH